jgi:hypothetical protein
MHLKTEQEVRREREEALAIAKRIIEATDTVPKHVLAGSQQTAAAFKDHAVKARRQAENKVYAKDLVKMRSAWNLISGYYLKP